MLRRLVLPLAIALVAAGAADARGRGFHPHRGVASSGGHGFRLSGVAHASAPSFAAKPPSEHRRRRAGSAEIKDLGPSTFQPVKRYRGFSYLHHEKHPEPDS